jgi:hypothetical protein
MRAEDIRAALAKKFVSPEYALFFEVGDATGGRARRWADAVAMGIWPSRGLALQGFEIKVSRSDLLSELKNPAKAESIARYCRYWWLATPPGLVRDGELPEGWGLYEAHPNGLRMIKPAPALTEQPVSPEFLAAILRRASECDRRLHEDAIAKAINRDQAHTNNRIAAEVEWRTRHAEDRATSAEGKLQAIYDACGLSAAEVSHLFYDGGFGAAVGLVHRLGVAKTYGGLRDIAEKLKPMADAVERLVPPETDRAAA